MKESAKWMAVAMLVHDGRDIDGAVARAGSSPHMWIRLEDVFRFDVWPDFESETLAALFLHEMALDDERRENRGGARHVR